MIEEQAFELAPLSFYPNYRIINAMCRVFAYTGNANATLLQSALTQFGKLAETGKVRSDSPPGHPDGWGLVSYQSGALAFHKKEPASAAGNPAFAEAARTLAARHPALVIGHLRKASVGNNLTQNTHPFWLENLSFCHNGTVKNFEKIALSSESKELRKGTSDSEWLFLRLRELFAENPTRAFPQLVKQVRTLDYSAFIVLFSDGKKLWALREVNEQESSIRSERALDTYYTLFLGATKSGATFICSEPLEIQGATWTPIKNHELITIESRISSISQVFV